MVFHLSDPGRGTRGSCGRYRFVNRMDIPVEHDDPTRFLDPDVSGVDLRLTFQRALDHVLDLPRRRRRPLLPQGSAP
jgi:hypothetical protein